MTATPAFSLARRLRAGETVYSAWCGFGVPLIAVRGISETDFECAARTDALLA